MTRVRRKRALLWLGAIGCSLSAALFVLSGRVRFAHFAYSTNEFYEGTLDAGMLSYGRLTRPASYIAILAGRLSPGWHVTPHSYGWSAFGSIGIAPAVEWQPQFRQIAVPLWVPFASSLVLLFLYWWSNRPPPTGFCAHCRYDLTSNVSGTCPECGMAVSAIQPIAAGTIFRRARRVVLRRRQLKLWMRRFATVRRWTYTTGAAIIAVMWALSFFQAMDYVAYEGDLARDQSLSILTVSIEKGRLNAVADDLGSSKTVPVPASLPTSGWHSRDAGTPTTSSIHEFREKLDSSIHLSASAILGFSLGIPFLILLLLALIRWRRDRLADSRA